MEEAYNDLYKTVWITRGARFIASYRNKRLQKISSFGISILSFYIISLGIYSIYSTNEFIVSKINLFSLCSSVFILVLSVHEGSKQFDLKAHLFHTCGKELSEIYNKLKYDIKLQNFNQISFQKILTEYEAIVQKYDENHTEIDDKLFRTKNWYDFHEFFYSQQSQPTKHKIERNIVSVPYSLKRLWYSTSVFWLYISIIVVPPILFLILIYKGSE